MSIIKISGTVEQQIQNVLDEEVNPMVASHGGVVSLLEVKDQNNALTLTANTDTDTCYIALNYFSFYNAADPNLTISDARWEKFNQSILSKLIMPLAEVFDLPLTNRTSFGFPIANIGDTGKTIRFTMGVEYKDQLEKYAEILAFSCFVINRLGNPERLLDDVFRAKYFSRNVSCFKSMTIPNTPMVITKERNNGDKIKYILQNEQIVIDYFHRYRPSSGEGDTYNQQSLAPKTVFATIYDGETTTDIPLGDVSLLQRKCLASCLDSLTFLAYNAMGIPRQLSGGAFSNFQFLKLSLIPPRSFTAENMLVNFAYNFSTNTIAASGLHGLNINDSSMFIRSSSKVMSLAALTPEHKKYIFSNC